MASTKYFYALVVCFCLTACSIEEKPQYYLNDAPLRIFQGGDKLTYSVLDSTISNYVNTLTSEDKFLPNDNTIELLFELQETNGNTSPPLAPQYFQQNDNGDLIIKAIGNSGEVLWLVDDNDDVVDEILYPSDITTLSTENSFTRKLLRCDENNNECFNAGTYTLHNLQFIKTETIETDYAFFESYKMNISIEIEIVDALQAGNFKSHTFIATQWFYPLLGVIKYVDNNNVIGNLSQTNISISDTYKQIN